MIDVLQQQLSTIYGLERDYDIRDFLITDPVIAKALGRGEMLADTKETLLIAHSDEELSLSLFLDEEMLKRVESGKPLDRLRSSMLDELWQVIEGVSHFSCVAWKAASDRTLSLFELELQGEIDKFVTTLLIAMQQANLRLSRNLHGLLFDNVSYREDLTAEQADRYRDANDYAARFCYGLRQQLQDDGPATLTRLREFYRLQSVDKISHIRSEMLAA